jgi:hypothetical protein
MTSPDEPTIADPPAKQHGDVLDEAVEASPDASAPDDGEADAG